MTPHIQIISDGTTHGTTVLIDGKPANDILNVEWRIAAHPDGKPTAYATATITFEGVTVNAQADHATTDHAEYR
jgi:hypothetical protein